jgi:hypothetical protein
LGSNATAGRLFSTPSPNPIRPGPEDVAERINRYTKTPFVESVPEHGYQGKETPREIYRKGIETLGNFADLPPAQQDQKLRSIQTTTFFRILRQHTIEGMFSDRMAAHRISRSPDELSRRDRQKSWPTLAPQADEPRAIVGHPVTGWEEEKD